MNRPSLQGALLRYLVEHRGVRAEPRQVFIMPSAQAAIELVARVVLDAGDLAWLESPGYTGARGAFEAAGAFPRQALHAGVLGFFHPTRQVKLRFESPWPPDLAGLVKALRGLVKMAVS